MAVDCHNDSKLLTQAAWSWPSRSLAHMHAERQTEMYDDDDLSFQDFEAPALNLHYRDPVHYAEMLHIEGDIERKKLKYELDGCLRFSVQMDGSVDRKQHDRKFVFVRYNTMSDPLQIVTKYVSANMAEHRKSKGLFKVFLSSLTAIGLSTKTIKEKFAGITTEGESANTG